MTDAKLNPGENNSMSSGEINSIAQGVQDMVSHGMNHINGFNHPNIDPVAIAFGGFEVRWYSLAYLVGIILGWLYVNYLNRRYANNYMPTKAIENLPLWMVLSIVLGGRLGYVLFYNFEHYKNNIADIIKVWEGGMSFHGGLIGIIVGTFIFSRIYKLQYLKVTDFVAVAAPIGLFFGRIANFINKELVGREVINSDKFKWGIFYPKENFPRHASQLYESFMEGFVLFMILLITATCFRGFEKKGLLSGLFLIFYGMFRIIGEMFREPDTQVGFVFMHVSLGQILCLPMMLLGVFILLFYTMDKKQNIIN